MRAPLCWSLSALLSAAALPGLARAQGPVPPTIVIGETDTIKSAALKEARPYIVYTPPSYTDTTYSPRTYPVLYLLDGDAHFHSVTGLIQILGSGVNGTFVIPEMIVVAIPNTDRLRDLSPTHVTTDYYGKPDTTAATSGGMPQFLQFIKTELIPHIDSAYRTAPYRVLVGHSLGGITVIQALYTMPETFNAYLAIDPSLWWDRSLLLRKAKTWATTTKLEGRTLFVGQANTIMADDTVTNQHFNDIVQFNGIMESYHPAGLRYAYKYYPNDSHGSVPLIAEYDGLRSIFADYNADIFRGMEDPAFLVNHYAKLSKSYGYTLPVPEGMFDLLGQFEMTRDKEKGFALLKLSTETYPRSAHAWTSLGDGWQAKGDAGQAKRAYEKALAVKPAYAAAAEKLKAMADAKK